MASKTNSFHRASSYKRLGLTEVEVAKLPQISPQLKFISRRIKLRPSLAKCWPTFLCSSEDPEMRKLTDLYFSMDQFHADLLPIEAYCAKVGISPLRVLDVINAVVMRQTMQAAAMIAAFNQPDVVKATVDSALTPLGEKDRLMLHKATGFLPTPKGSQTIVNVNQKTESHVQADKAIVIAPSSEQTIRRLADRFNESRLLPGSPDQAHGGNSLPDGNRGDDPEVEDSIEALIEDTEA